MLTSVKSLALPPIETPEMLTGPALVLVRVAICAKLVVPWVWLPKLNELGASETVGAIPTPESKAVSDPPE